MQAYKFLERDGRSIWSSLLWPQPRDDRPGAWVESTEVRPCHAGVHACRRSELSYWMRWSMWEIELDGEITESRHKIVAPRGRLVRAIGEYPDAVRELGEVSAWRTRDRAVTALRADGRDALADAFTNCDTLGALEAVGAEVPDDGSHASQASFMAADCGHFAPHGAFEHSPFIACNSAGYEAEDFDTGFAAERAFQSQWLADRLALPE